MEYLKNETIDFQDNSNTKPERLTFYDLILQFQSMMFLLEDPVKVKVGQLCPTLCDHMDHTVHGILQARILEWVAFPFSRGSSQPRDRTQVSCIAGGFFTIWATREAQEYWSGSLSLLQGIFPVQGSNPGLLHCRQILYQLSHRSSIQIQIYYLSHQGSPQIYTPVHCHQQEEFPQMPSDPKVLLWKV